MSSKLAMWVDKFVNQTTKEWDWPVTYSIDEPEEYQTSYQIFLTLKNLQLSVVVLFDRKTAEVSDVAQLKEKINLALIRLKELAEERVIT